MYVFFSATQVSVQNAYSSLLIFCSLLFHQNKSAFLCGVMKTYRQREKQGTKVSDSNKGPDEAKIKVSFLEPISEFCNQFLHVSGIKKN